jgi:FixJ family two-component response regulator
MAPILGAIAVLDKPVQMDSLIDAVRKALAAS